jgi:hypothetical protein
MIFMALNLITLLFLTIAPVIKMHHGTRFLGISIILLLTVSCSEDEIKLSNTFEGDVFIYSQQSLEDFADLGYTQIAGRLLLGSQSYNDKDSDLIDLSLLRNLNSVESLTIRNCKRLKSTSGLEKLDVTDYLAINYCDSLERVEMSVSKLEGMWISENPNLTDLSGFPELGEVEKIYVSNIKSIQGLPPLNVLDEAIFYNFTSQNLSEIGELTVSGHLSLGEIEGLEDFSGLNKNNTSLEHLSLVNIRTIPNLSGLEHIRYIGFLDLYGMSNLISLDGLDNLESVERLSIQTNTSLVDYCSILPAINSLQAEDMYFFNNGYSLTIDKISKGLCSK